MSDSLLGLFPMLLFKNPQFSLAVDIDLLDNVTPSGTGRCVCNVVKGASMASVAQRRDRPTALAIGVLGATGLANKLLDRLFGGIGGGMDVRDRLGVAVGALSNGAVAADEISVRVAVIARVCGADHDGRDEQAAGGLWAQTALATGRAPRAGGADRGRVRDRRGRH